VAIDLGRQVFGPSSWSGKRHQLIAHHPMLLADFKKVEELCEKKSMQSLRWI
jgi:hypothetical protein